MRSQKERIRILMEDEGWRLLSTIKDYTGAPETAVSARLREFRHEGYYVDLDHREEGIYYRMRAKTMEEMTKGLLS